MAWGIGTKLSKDSEDRARDMENDGGKSREMDTHTHTHTHTAIPNDVHPNQSPSLSVSQPRALVPSPGL